MRSCALRTLTLFLFEFFGCQSLTLSDVASTSPSPNAICIDFLYCANQRLGGQALSGLSIMSHSPR